MSKNVIVITVDENIYQVEKNGISDFTLIGVLECIVADLKGVSRQSELSSLMKDINKPGEEPVNESTVSSGDVESRESEIQTEEKPTKPPTIESTPIVSSEVATPDIKSRIKKAREAIRGLKGEVDDTDLNIMTEEDLQEEFEALTAQYKRLKNSQVNKKK